jgi:hypothetical protein
MLQDYLRRLTGYHQVASGVLMISVVDARCAGVKSPVLTIGSVFFTFMNFLYLVHLGTPAGQRAA